jgi:CBS domain-containing protein/uncharacterized protein (DUF2267 family)
MSLDRYRRARMVVLHPSSNVHATARAMGDNHIGSVLVAEHQRLLGIVTDRDLVLEIVAGDLAHTTPVRDVMSDEVAAVPVTASVEDVVRTMREHGCRRVPLVEDGKPVGLVTLDDLLLDGAIDAAAARSIIVAQLEVADRFKAEGAVHPDEPARPGVASRRGRAILRRKARAESAHARLLRAVEAHSGLRTREQAELSLLVVLGMLCRRVTPDQARHLIAQLPSKLHPELEKDLGGPDRHVTREKIEAELMSRLKVGEDVAAVLLTSVCEALADCVTAGEIESFRGQLPLDMKDLFPPTPLRRSA